MIELKLGTEVSINSVNGIVARGYMNPCLHCMLATKSELCNAFACMSQEREDGISVHIERKDGNAIYVKEVNNG